MGPGAGPGLRLVVTQRQLGLVLPEGQDGRQCGGVLGQLLAPGEAERDRLEAAVAARPPIFSRRSPLTFFQPQGRCGETPSS